MKFILTLFLITFSFAEAEPKLEIIGGYTYDWKDVTPGDSPLKAAITLKNSGNETLKISSVKPSCSCTTAPLDKYELEPGESVAMNVTLTLNNDTYKVEKKIGISSNDPENPKQTLYLKANVIHPIGLYPFRFFKFSEVKEGDISESVLTIKNHGSKELTLSDFRVSPDGLSINLNGKVKLAPGEEIKLIAKYKSTAAGKIQCKVIMTTDHDTYKKITIFGECKVSE